MTTTARLDVTYHRRLVTLIDRSGISSGVVMDSGDAVRQVFGMALRQLRTDAGLSLRALGQAAHSIRCPGWVPPARP